MKWTVFQINASLNSQADFEQVIDHLGGARFCTLYIREFVSSEPNPMRRGLVLSPLPMRKLRLQ